MNSDSIRVTRQHLAEVPPLVPRSIGAPAGIEAADLTLLPSGSNKVRITCIDYCPDQVQIQEIKDLDHFLAHHRPAWSAVRWINIDGLTQMDILRGFAEKYQLHPLAIEDVLHTHQRPKVEDYPSSGDHPGRLFLVARMLEKKDDQLYSEQLSIFLGRNTLLTFQETPGDNFDPIRQRLQVRSSRLRENDVSFLLYALLDALMDSFFPVLEGYHERLESLEEEVLDKPTRATLQKIHDIKRELVIIRRAAWPMRDVIAQLLREKHECLSETTRTYFRDIYDHCVQIIDLIESYREISGALTETYMSVVSNRMNEVMKVLTIMGSIFIPLTFLAGVYGMNMPIPENEWEGIKHYSYPAFWVICFSVAGGMLFWFKRRGWI